MADRHDFKKIIEEIESAGLSIGKIALLLHLEPTQIRRIKEKGRCQHWQGEMLLEIHREYVPRLSVQIVTTRSAFLMQNA